jgi:hypothetical protein
LGTEFADSSNDPYRIYIDKTVEARVAGNTHVGIYRGTNKMGYAVLLPFIHLEFHPEIRGEGLDEGDKMVYSWNLNEPDIFKSEAIVGMNGIVKSYLDNRIEISNRLLKHFSPEIIVP